MDESDVQTDYSGILEIIKEIFGEVRNYNDYKQQLSVDCPVCSIEKGLDGGDGRSTLEINLRLGVYRCWSCAETNDTHGTLYKLIKTYGSSKQLKKYKLLKPDQDTDQPLKVNKKIYLPQEFVSFKSASNGLKMTHYYKQAINYLRKRNITDEMIDKFNIGFCYSGIYENRIIIPSYVIDK